MPSELLRPARGGRAAPGSGPGALASPEGTRGYTHLVDIPDLIRRLEELDAAHGVERARLARLLTAQARLVVAAAGDEGVFEATRAATYAEVAAELGVSVDAVRKAVRQRARRARAG